MTASARRLPPGWAIRLRMGMCFVVPTLCCGHAMWWQVDTHLAHYTALFHAPQLFMLRQNPYKCCIFYERSMLSTAITGLSMHSIMSKNS